VTAILEVGELAVTFGGLRAVDSVTLEVEGGQLVGVIGPNGAGKTTLIDAVTGFVECRGRVLFDGSDVSSVAPHRRAHAGLARTWQSLELFDDLTVAENVEVAAERRRPVGFLADLVRPRRGQRHPQGAEVLRRLGIEPLANRLPTELSHGQRKLVGVARALAAQPRLICMDEPAAGLDRAESAALGRTLRAIVSGGTSILLVDHDMGLVLQVCDYIYALEFGRVIARGAPDQIRNDERVISAYLGERSRRDLAAAKTVLAEVPIADPPGLTSENGSSG
jgi:branched-chain amino acid transport system ATP-binding protein